MFIFSQCLFCTFSLHCKKGLLLFLFLDILIALFSNFFLAYNSNTCNNTMWIPVIVWLSYYALHPYMIYCCDNKDFYLNTWNEYHRSNLSFTCSLHFPGTIVPLTCFSIILLLFLLLFIFFHLKNDLLSFLDKKTIAAVAPQACNILKGLVHNHFDIHFVFFKY